MRRRFTIAIVGTVAFTLVVVGVGTLALARIDARARTRDELEDRATAVAAAVAELRPATVVRTLARLRASLDVDGVAVVRIGPEGSARDPLPDGVDVDDLDLAALRSGRPASGSDRDLAFAAAPIPELANERVLPVVVVTRSVKAEVGTAGRWFVVAGGLTLLLGTFVAWRLGRRVTGPLREVEGAAQRIAAGDLTVRVPERATGDDEVAALVRSVNTMAAELERSRGAEQQFLLSVSHDLRTPLTSIRGWAEAIADGATTDPAGAAGIVLAEARRLERLVRDLLDLARLRTAGFTLAPVPVDLADVASGTAEGLRPDLEDAGVRVVVDAPTPAIVDGDPDRLAQACANLVENAGRFARTTVRVVVGVDAGTGTGTAVLAVEDDGPGIPAADLPFVFERLYVAGSRPARRENGSGLGLAIVRELALAMGGDAVAGRAAGGGARLELRLPLARQP